MLNTLLPAASPAALRRANRAARLLRARRAARLSNPRNAGLYAGPLTITDSGATLPAATSKQYKLDATVTPANLGIWHVTGGKLVAVGGAASVVATYLASGSPGYGAWRAEAMANARYVALRLLPSTVPYRFLIDGQYVSVAGTTPATTTGTTHQYLLLDLGARGVHRIAIEGQQQTCCFVAAYVEATGAMWPIDTSDAVHVAMIGDSYVQGSAATAKGDGVAMQLGDWLGAHMHACGSGGTGWATTVNYRFDQRIANGDLALSYYPPDVIFTMGSYNDRAAAAATITANALAGLVSARAQYPDVPIIVFGVCPGSSGPSSGSPSILQAEAAVQAAVAQFADPFCAFVPVSTDPNGAWVSGTGKAGTTTGAGNSDWATTSDGIHPSDEGCAMIGRRYAEGAIAAIKAIYRL